MKKVELLSPAGNFEALKGAVKAGADAVYLGGAAYGARAYAQNFTQEELEAGIRFAHIFGKRVYLTVNTLVKEGELDNLYPFLQPLYESGLDGVIVQDLGVLRYIKNHFPQLALHASTQMTLTGSWGAELMKEEGVTRIVPARELSLEEIRKIKRETGLEIEVFVHGAMCYCYSGQCLLSSMLGGRSGNRGRCAQPCRLPYEGISCKEGKYPLSMRDMCTIELLPQLLEAGIDSFKIEGRMKKPAYTAGVTAIYRKYMDLYEKDPENYQVSKEDRDLLKKLYIRSEIGDGYYKRHNGREMISIQSPAYTETPESILDNIRRRYLTEEPFLEAEAEISLIPDKKALLSLKTGKILISAEGEAVQKALRQPLKEEKIIEQVQKTGNSPVKIKHVKVLTEEPVFLPVSALNELRRKAVAALEEAVIRDHHLDYPNRSSCHSQEGQRNTRLSRGNFLPKSRKRLHVQVQTWEQLEGVLSFSPGRIYLDHSFLEGAAFERLKSLAAGLKEKGTALYLASPFVVRAKDEKRLQKMAMALREGIVEGILVKNLESFRFFAGQADPRQLVLDANLYIWNRESLHFWEERAQEFFLPLECNQHEWKALFAACPDRKIQASAIVYGRLPMMVTANCIKKTLGTCSQGVEWLALKDRYGKNFPVYTDCLCCYNVIYNTIPLSLHKLFAGEELGMENFRLDFTTEKREEVSRLLSYFISLMQEYRDPFYQEYTTGHYKRGVV